MVTETGCAGPTLWLTSGAPTTENIGMKKLKFTLAVILMVFAFGEAASALDVNDFSCVLPDYYKSEFRKRGNSGVFTANNATSNGLNAENFVCDEGASAEYSQSLFCSRHEEFPGVARTSTHLVFLNDYSLLVMSNSSFSPSGEHMGFGSTALVLEANCR